jgi:hypothetical protein
MPELTNTRPFVRGVLTSLRRGVDDRLRSEIALGRGRTSETVLLESGRQPPPYRDTS